jgi:hypothetical protein
MMRWISKRRLLAGILGTTVAVSLALGQGGEKDVPSAPPKVGDVLTLPFPEGKERKLKVISIEKTVEGEFLAEVKDVKTGETLRILDKRWKEGAQDSEKTTRQPDPIKTKEPALPKVKETPPPPAVSTKAPATGNSGARMPAATATKATPTTESTKKTNPPADPAKSDPPRKTGLLGRIFGPKKPPAPTNTNTSTPTNAGTKSSADAGSTPAMPPSVRPTPSFTPPRGNGTTTAEPPLVAPGKPGSPPSQVVLPPTSNPSAPMLFPESIQPPPLAPSRKQSPPALPTVPETPTPSLPAAPVTPAPLPVPMAPATPLPDMPAAPLPSVPVSPLPTVPSSPTPAIPLPIPSPSSPTPVPMLPGSPGGLPPIPIPPGIVSSKQVPVVQVQMIEFAQPRLFAPAMSALMHDVQPYIDTLRNALPPSERIMAVRSLAGCRHGSTDTVKTLLFQACKEDPCPLVRACCIDELRKLGCYDPVFLAHLQRASRDHSDEVRTAARDALAMMKPRNGEE